MGRREQSVRLAFESRVWWWRVLMDLRVIGWSAQRVARSTGIPKSTLLHWMGGGEAKHADGERVIRLWCFATGHTRNDIPMT